MALVDVLECPSQVVLYSPCFDETILIEMYQRGNFLLQPWTQYFCNNFCYTINEWDWPEVIDSSWSIDFWYQGYESIIKRLNISSAIVKLLTEIANILPDDIPAFLMKRPLKPSGPGALSIGMCLMTASISSTVKGSSS
jgi:hypothetical protein